MRNQHRLTSENINTRGINKTVKEQDLINVNKHEWNSLIIF